MKDAKEIADKYFERYSKLTTSTNRIAIITLLVLVTNWIFIVETNHAKYISVKQDFKERFRAIENQFVIIDQKYSEDTATYKVERQKLVTQKDELAKEKESSLKDKMSDVKDLPSLVKFIFFISDNLEKGALILIILFCALLIYLLSIRRTSLKYLSKALRIYKIEPTLQINQYQDFNLSSPIWLAPLPRKQNKDVVPVELKTILGWTFNHKFFKSILLVLLISIVIIQSRLSYITFIVNGSKFNSIFFISALFVLLTALIITYWLMPIKIEDNFNYENNPNPLSRRDFVILSTFGLFSAALYKVAPLFPKYIHKRAPRFRVNKLKLNFSLPSLKSVLAKNKKSDIVHFINSEGFSQTFKNIQSNGDFEKFSEHLEAFNEINALKTKKGKPRMPLGISSWHSENAALEKIKSANYINATEILIYSIRQNIGNFTPSYRLHDLLALICIRYKTIIPGNVWQNLIELSNNSKDVQLIARVKKWNDRKWVEKISKKKKIVFNKTTI
ncbi:MAG: hypothetical protein KF862_22820 [Chitinophagaceae bacterium]|nr:hypothetical protein [Chitinophagaceae bacterium]